MRHTIRRAALGLLIASVLTLDASGLGVLAQSSTNPSDWVTTSSGDNTQIFIPTDSNRAGTVVGLLQMPDGFHPAQLRDGEISLLGDGTEQGRASAINDDGTIVGTKNYPDNRSVAAVFTPGSTIELNDGQAFDIDSSGTIVGSVNNVPAYWPQGGSPLALPTLLEGQPAYVTAINQQGWMVGDSIGPHPTDPDRLADHAVLWRDGQITDLGSVVAGDTIAADINASGTGVAWTQTSDVNDASNWTFDSFTWKDGVLTELPLPEGDTSCMAMSISDSGWIAGSCGIGAHDQHGVLWIDDQVIAIEELMGEGWRAGSAVINDDGQIVGQGYFQNELKVYMLTPQELGSCKMRCVLKQFA